MGGEVSLASGPKDVGFGIPLDDLSWVGLSFGRISALDEFEKLSSWSNRVRLGSLPPGSLGLPNWAPSLAQGLDVIESHGLGGGRGELGHLDRVPERSHDLLHVRYASRLFPAKKLDRVVPNLEGACLLHVAAEDRGEEEEAESGEHLGVPDVLEGHDEGV